MKRKGGAQAEYKMTFSYWITIYEYIRCPKCFGLGHLNDGWTTFTMTNSTFPQPVEVYRSPSTLCPLCKGIVKIKPYQKINMKGK